MSRKQTVSDLPRSPALSRLSLLAVAVTALGLAMVPVTGCHGSAPSLLLRVADPTGVEPTQLRVTVNRQGADPVAVVRPETPGAPLAPGQTLRLFLPVEAIGTRVALLVEGLTAGSVIAEGAGLAEIVDGREVELQVSLEPVGEVCDPSACETGCCRDGACASADEGPCDGETACDACDPLRSDACEDDTCRCGEGPACDLAEVCLNGACVAGSECHTEEDCSQPSNVSCYEHSGACVDGLCELQPKAEGEACEDGLHCTENTVCDGAGSCGSGTEVVCVPGSNPCLLYNTVCDPGFGCTRMVANDSPCPGPNACTAYTCQQGQCTDSGPACAEGQSCCPDHPQQLCFDEDPNDPSCLTPAG